MGSKRIFSVFSFEIFFQGRAPGPELPFDLGDNPQVNPLTGMSYLNSARLT